MNKKVVMFFSIIIVIIISSVIGYYNYSTIKNQQEYYLEELEALPYLSHVENERDGDKIGVVLNNKNLSSSGLNLFSSMGEGKVYLVDMEGKVLHSWKPTGNIEALGFSRIDDNLNLVSVKNGLIKLDWNSNILWYKEGDYHHEINFDDEGRIYSIGSKNIFINYSSKLIPIRNDYLTLLSREGKIIKKISIYDLMKGKIPRKMLDIIEMNIQEGKVVEKKLGPDSVYDIFHTNTINLIDRDIGIAKEGDLLICLRNLNLILIIDPEKQRVVWEWELEQIGFDRPHYPDLLENGNILIYDNGWHRGYSRVVELDPYEKEIVWEYKGKPKESFYAQKGGMAQKLPNGNVLITEQNKGHVFEITEDGELVWDFWNFNFGGRKRETIYRFIRLIDNEENSKVFKIMENIKTGVQT